MAEQYDLVVIGSGPGGQRSAIQAAKLGKRVAVIEQSDQLGGAALRGGTPSPAVVAGDGGVEGIVTLDGCERMTSLLAAMGRRGA